MQSSSLVDMFAQYIREQLTNFKYEGRTAVNARVFGSPCLRPYSHAPRPCVRIYISKVKKAAYITKFTDFDALCSSILTVCSWMGSVDGVGEFVNTTRTCVDHSFITGFA